MREGTRKSNERETEETQVTHARWMSRSSTYAFSARARAYDRQIKTQANGLQWIAADAPQSARLYKLGSVDMRLR